MLLKTAVFRPICCNAFYTWAITLKTEGETKQWAKKSPTRRKVALLSTFPPIRNTEQITSDRRMAFYRTPAPHWFLELCRSGLHSSTGLPVLGTPGSLWGRMPQCRRRKLAWPAARDKRWQSWLGRAEWLGGARDTAQLAGGGVGRPGCVRLKSTVTSGRRVSLSISISMRPWTHKRGDFGSILTLYLRHLKAEGKLLITQKNKLEKSDLENHMATWLIFKIWCWK